MFFFTPGLYNVLSLRASEFLAGCSSPTAWRHGLKLVRVRRHFVDIRRDIGLDVAHGPLQAAH
jgi:hypothetical protein